MRIVMPLFKFSYEGAKFQFTDNVFLERFSYEKDVPQDIPGISRLDASHISLEHWALTASYTYERYESEINLLLAALRIYAQANAFVKWRFCSEDPSQSTRIPSSQRFRKLASSSSRRVDEQTLIVVRDGFLRLLEMYSASDRTKNALYFLWRGLCSVKHIDAYIFLVCVIEALFSNDTPEDATKILIKRTQRFLSGIKGYGGDQIKSIYKIRSNMVHGRILHTEQGSERVAQNVRNLAKLESLVFACLRKMLDERIYLEYRDDGTREKLLNGLMKSKP